MASSQANLLLASEAIIGLCCQYACKVELSSTSQACQWFFRQVCNKILDENIFVANLHYNLGLIALPTP